MPVEAPAGNGTIGAVAPPAIRRALIPTPQREELRNTNEIVILSDAGWIQDYLFWGMTMTPGGYTHHQHFHSGRSNCPLISIPSKSQSPDCTTSLPVPVTEACKVRRAVLTTRRQIMCRNKFTSRTDSSQRRIPASAVQNSLNHDLSRSDMMQYTFPPHNEPRNARSSSEFDGKEFIAVHLLDSQMISA